jgi:hypothetical protein
MTKLGIDDIADLRAYERERAEFRQHIVALKRRRRVGVGPVVTLLFENRDTIRFQVQEMARAERILTDAGIRSELDVYNPLVPEPGQLAATLFVELTSEDDLREWLPRLVGIEMSVELRIGAGDALRVVRCEVDSDHLSQLTRDEVTAAVHYVHFRLTPEEVEAVRTGPVALAIRHPNYDHASVLSTETIAELLVDLQG